MSERLLIVGADGLIGSALLQHWRARGLPVAGTSRRTGEGSAIHLDLASPVADWPEFADFRSAVICGAVTSNDQCRRDAAATRHVNVEQTVQLAEYLAGQGIFVVFLSSNAVFDGTRPLRNPEEPLCPMTEYGRQKAEAEKKLAELEGQVAIVRLTKVVHSRLPLLRGWMSDLNQGKIITPFSDHVCAPIHLDTVVPAIAAVAEHRLKGIWQLSPQADVTYEAIARRLAQLNALDAKLVHPVSIRDSASLEHLPRHATLNARQSADRLGFRILDPMDVINELIVL